MDRQDFLKFANDNPLCFVATVDGDQPHVRTFRLEQADETGFYFTLVTKKKMYQQVCANPRVEVCFFNPTANAGGPKQMRVTGILEEIDDPVMLEKAYDRRKVLEPQVGEPVKPLLRIFRLSKGDMHFWTMNEAMREEIIKILHF